MSPTCFQEIFLIVKRLCYFQIVVLWVGASLALAAPDSFVLQGQIIKPNGEALENSSVNFNIKIYSPGLDNCLLFEEDFSSVNMEDSAGLFSLSIGTGTRSGSDFEGTSNLESILKNSGSLNPTTCVSGGPTYTPSLTDERLLRLTFDDGSGAVTLAQDHVIKSAPYSLYASQISGIDNNNILQANQNGAQLTQANLENVFASPTDDDDLRDLIDGNSKDYLSSYPAASVGFNSQRVTDVGAPADANDATNKNYVDSNLGGESFNPGPLGMGDSGKLLGWDGSQWVTVATGNGDIIDGGNSTGATLVLGTTDTQSLELHTGGSTALTIDTSQGVSLAAGLGVTGGINTGGNVGIGTTNPSGALHVYGANRDVHVTSITDNPSDGADVDFYRSRYDAGDPEVVSLDDKLGGIRARGYDGNNYPANSGAYMEMAVDGVVANNIVPGRFSFYTENASGNYGERFQISSSGNIGVGTSSPQSLLHFFGDNDDLFLESNGSAAPSNSADIELRRSRAGAIVQDNDRLGALYFMGHDGSSYVSSGDRHAFIRAHVDGTPGVADMPTRLEFGVTDDGNNNADTAMTLSREGWLGIGVTNPEAKLHIDGAGAGAGVCVTADGGCGAVPSGGQISAEATLNTGADYAEYFEAEESLPQGELVGLNMNTGKVRGYKPGDKLLGVVSTEPGIVGNSELGNSTRAVLVALVGQVPILKDRIIEDNGVVSSKDGQSIGYRLSNGNVYLNLSSGTDSLKRQLASQAAINASQESRMSSQKKEIEELKMRLVEVEKLLGK